MKRICVSLLVVMLSAIPLFAGGNQESSDVAADGVIKLRLVGKDNSPTEQINVDHINRIEKAIYEKEGLKLDIELVRVPEGSYAEKLNLMIMSGDIPDIIYFQGNDQAIANQGILEDLRPWIATSEIMQKAMLDFNKKRIESYPYLLWLAPPRIRVPMVRSDWYEAYGKDVESLDDYYNMLVFFTEQGGIGLTDTGNTDRIDYVFNRAFGITSTWMKQENGWVYSRVTDEEKAKLAFYRKLYAEGILDPEYITTKWDTMEDKLYTGQVGMIASSAGTVVDIYESKMAKSAANSGLTILPPAKGVDQGFTVDVTKESRGWAISAGSKHKEAAWAFLEFMASDDGQMLDRLGFEGIHYTVEDGTIKLTDRFNEWWPRYHEVVGWKSPVPLLGESAQKSLDIAVEYTKEDINFLIPKELAPSWDALQNLYREYAFKLISGEYPMDRFDDFVKEWYRLGGDRLTEYAQTVLQ